CWPGWWFPTLYVRRAHLSGTGALGWPVRLYLFRGCVVGQIRSAERGWTVCRGAERRDDCLAAHRQGRARASDTAPPAAAAVLVLAHLMEQPLTATPVRRASDLPRERVQAAPGARDRETKPPVAPWRAALALAYPGCT